MNYSREDDFGVVSNAIPELRGLGGLAGDGFELWGEAELVKRFAVSHSVIREALQSLQGEGIVIDAPSFVTEQERHEPTSQRAELPRVLSKIRDGGRGQMHPVFRATTRNAPSSS